MVFHESLNQERKFSLAIPLVFIAILGGTTAVLEVATVLSPQASYAVNPQAQLAQGAASSDPKEADKLCPAAKPRESVYAGKSQPKLIKTEVAKNTFVMVENLSWRQCQHTEDTDIAAQGYCIGEDICHADICDSKQCTLRKIPGSGSGAGTGFEGPTAEDLLADIQTNERTVAKLNEEKAQFEASMNAIGSEPFPKESEIKDLEKKVVEQKTAFEQITGMSYDDPSVGKPGDPKNPTEQEMYNQENVAKLRDEQRQLSAELVKDPNNETLLNRQKEISRDLGTQNTFASLKDDSWAGANFNYETPGDQNATKDLNGDWTKDFNFQTAGADALDPSVAKATEDAKGDWTQYDDKSDMGAMGKYLNPQVPPEKPGDWADEKNNYGNPYAPEQTTDPKGSPVPNTSDEDAPPPVGAVVPSCTGKSCDYMVNANDKDMIEGYKAAGLKCGDAIDGAVVCSGAGTGKVTNTRTPGGKVDANGNPVTPPGTKTGGGDATKGGGGGDMGKAFGSLLEGLMKALGAPKPPPPAPAQACATDQNAYAQQQQQYQQQLQQYNYQLQQAQYQQQMNQYYAERNGGIAPPTQPLPQQPTPCTPSTGSQCREQPQQPPPSACSAGAWRATYQGACISGWQCISTQGPKAELVCEPDLADVGQTLALTYNCSSGIASSSAFKVTTQPGGSATTTVKAPPQGTNTATYTLACTDQGKTTGAQCSVKVNRPNIILVANPKTVQSGEISLLSWLTTGMDSCVISSPDQADFTLRNSSYTSVTGAATTSPVAGSARFQLDCVTISGMDKQATTSVSVAE